MAGAFRILLASISVSCSCVKGPSGLLTPLHGLLEGKILGLWVAQD